MYAARFVPLTVPLTVPAAGVRPSATSLFLKRYEEWHASYGSGLSE